MKDMKNKITNEKIEYFTGNEENHVEKENNERSVGKMKGIFKKIKAALVLAGFLGATGAGMTTLMSEPVAAQEVTEIRVADAKSGYSIPSEITIKEGESKVINVTAPNSSNEVYNVSFNSTRASYVGISNLSAGSYWGKPGKITVKGKTAGYSRIIAFVKVYRKNGNKKTFVKEVQLECKVNVESAKKSTGSKTTSNKKPLQSISLNTKSLSLSKGNSNTLKVSYYPTNTTDSKNVSWSSSNAYVATVNGGKVVAKNPGTTTITAKVGGKTATCNVTVKAPSSNTKTTNATGSEKYWNVSEAYILTNQFRTNRSNQWYWNANNKTKTYTYGLKGLTRDAALENTAKLRAKEQWTQYYVNGKKTHDRPNGKSCFTAFPKGYRYMAENLGWGQNSSRQIILDGTNGWAETNKYYADQGHRRNMLSSNYTKVGIACYEKNGKTCWAMCLGR